ncbi:NAD(P)/FAD-dependent oxidoreductase [Stella sp.]|uniref:NAD(P)/FAD-dependent oxidoreductase n=1 Tax=Stella sp. TaxID=2912054 RepID=UPI0035B333E8
MSQADFSPDLKLQPYWWDHVPRPDLPAADLPKRVDVLIVGSGYTGLNAALVTARGGRETLVIDAEDAGFGCSTRNGGQISTSIKPTYEKLAARLGADLAFRIKREGFSSREWVEELVRRERIDCDFEVNGRFHGAHNPAQYEALARQLASQPKGLEQPYHMVPRAEQRRELGTDAYFGGAVYEAHAGVDPARLHQGLLERVREAGAVVVPHTRATGIEPDGSGFRVTTSRGTVAARDVVVATNGYTEGVTPWLRRRVIPIGSYIVATEELPTDLVERLFPTRRVTGDTRRLVYYYRASPDGKRVLFGGRVSLTETDPKVSGPLLRAELVRLFPELAPYRISHTWCGFVAYTFDELMHCGRHDGVWYAMGYCGSGVGMANYLGMRIGQQVLGQAEGRTAFDGLPFQTRPFYTGNPWFLAPSIRYYRWMDSRPI